MAMAVVLLVLVGVIVVAASTFTTRPFEVSVLLLVTIASSAALAFSHSRLTALAVTAIPLVVFFTLKSIAETVGLITAARHERRPRQQASSADGRDDSRLAD
jgi:CHASE2 domain-containing sensor protein